MEQSRLKDILVTVGETQQLRTLIVLVEPNWCKICEDIIMEGKLTVTQDIIDGLVHNRGQSWHWLRPNHNLMCQACVSSITKGIQ